MSYKVIKRLNNPSIKTDYQLELSNRFEILADSSNNNNEINVSKMWEPIRETVKSAAKERVGEKNEQKNKPWFDQECLKKEMELAAATGKLLFNLTWVRTHF